MKGKSSGSGAKKYNRSCNKPTHQRYNQKRQWIENKARRVAKMIRKFPKYVAFNLSPDVKYFLSKMKVTA